MYGANPSTFKNLEAAILAARSYAIESGIDYGVMEKEDWCGMTWYRPVSANDTEAAKADGFEMLIGPNVLRHSETTNLPIHKKVEK